MRQENLDLNKKYFNIIGYVKKNPFQKYIMKHLWVNDMLRFT